jgi:hypothetical protein
VVLSDYARRRRRRTCPADGGWWRISGFSPSLSWIRLSEPAEGSFGLFGKLAIGRCFQIGSISTLGFGGSARFFQRFREAEGRVGVVRPHAQRQPVMGYRSRIVAAQEIETADGQLPCKLTFFLHWGPALCVATCPAE